MEKPRGAVFTIKEMLKSMLDATRAHEYKLQSNIEQHSNTRNVWLFVNYVDEVINCRLVEEVIEWREEAKARSAPNPNCAGNIMAEIGCQE